MKITTSIVALVLTLFITSCQKESKPDDNNNSLPEGWTRVSAPPLFGLKSGAIRLFDDNVIFIGGIDQRYHDDNDAYWNPPSLLYNTSTNSWTELPVCPRGGQYPSLVQLGNDKIVRCGGFWRGDYENSISIYDWSTNTWTFKDFNPNPGSTNTSWIIDAAPCPDGNLFIVRNDNVAVIDVYSLEEKVKLAWHNGSNNMGARCTVLKDGRIAVVGGGGASTTNEMTIYQAGAVGITHESFTLISSYSNTTIERFFTCVQPDGKLIIFGWSHTSGEIFDPSTGISTLIPAGCIMSPFQVIAGTGTNFWFADPARYAWVDYTSGQCSFHDFTSQVSPLKSPDAYEYFIPLNNNRLLMMAYMSVPTDIMGYTPDVNYIIPLENQ
jgi:hypothetical protein